MCLEPFFSLGATVAYGQSKQYIYISTGKKNKKTTTYHCQWLEMRFEPFLSLLGSTVVVEEAVQVVYMLVQQKKERKKKKKTCTQEMSMSDVLQAFVACGSGGVESMKVGDDMK